MKLEPWIDFLRTALQKLGRPSSTEARISANEKCCCLNGSWREGNRFELDAMMEYGNDGVFFGLSNPQRIDLKFRAMIQKQRGLFQDKDSLELQRRLEFSIELKKRPSDPLLIWQHGDWECIKALAPRFRAFLEGLLCEGRKRRRKPPSKLRISELNARRFTLLAIREMKSKHKGL